MKELRECYDKIYTLLGNQIESFESIELVEKYRRYWKPSKINVILLAESHVFTSTEESSLNISKPPGINDSYPARYARFVYCLAYGEPKLIMNNSARLRGGTPQYWELFYSCINKYFNRNDFCPILKRTPFKERLQNKVQLLNSLQEKGVWLVDTSIVALYNKNEKLKCMREIIKTSWDYYTKDVVTNAAPKSLICIGKGVADIIEPDLKNIVESYKVIPQPDAFLTKQQHIFNYDTCYDLCSKFAK